jgi:hypothetical protein
MCLNLPAFKIDFLNELWNFIVNFNESCPYDCMHQANKQHIQSREFWGVFKFLASDGTLLKRKRSKGAYILFIHAPAFIVSPARQEAVCFLVLSF